VSASEDTSATLPRVVESPNGRYEMNIVEVVALTARRA
jgi:hypothetical protein